MNSVYIEITDVCNLHCSFCPCGTRAEPRTFMPSDLFEKCLDGAMQIGATNVFFHVLGEPTLHPGFGLYLKKLEQTPLTLTLTTNGTTIARSGRSILDSKSIRQINFSTHALAELETSEAHDHLQNILDFCQMALAVRPDLYINLRLWNVGASEAEPWNNYMLASVNKTFSTEVAPGHFYSRHKSFNVKGRLYLHEDTRFEWPKPDEKRDCTFPSEVLSAKSKGTCHALDTHVAILHDGRVVACCLDHSGQITLGDIRTQTLAEILNSPMAQNIREGFASHELRHPFCQNCTYCRRFK